MKRPKLNEIPLQEALNTKSPQLMITMSENQWDMFLEEGYFKNNATLIEVDINEKPIKAYKKEG